MTSKSKNMQENNILDKRKLLEQLMKSQVSKLKFAPLSFAQRRLHFIYNLKPDSTAYHLSRAICLTRNLDILAFNKAINEIVRRQDSLRTKFQNRNNEDIQVVTPYLGINIPYIENPELPIDKREKKALEQAEEDMATPFNLSEGPLFRFKLYKITSDKHIFTICLHHIITDGWSMRLFYTELSALYNAFLNKTPSPFDELSIQYIDYTKKQLEQSKDDKLLKQLTYWREKLENPPITHQLPLDFVRPTEQTFQSEKVNFEIESTIVNSLKNICEQTMSTMFMVTLAAYSVLISRYSNTNDVILGSPIANRNHKDIESLIGFFVNTLAVRINIAKNITFKELLSQIKNTIIEASDNQDITFDQIVEELQPERNLNHNPIIQLVFAYHNLPLVNLNLIGIKTEFVSTDETTTTNDLEVHLNYSDKQISGYFIYNNALFLKEKIERMAEHFINILTNLSHDINQNVFDVNFLSEKEKLFILHELNSNIFNYPKNKSVCELFEEQVNKTPNNDAVVFKDKKITYKELNDRANQLSLILSEKGVKANSIVGVCLERGVDLIVSLVAITKSGGAYLPIDINTPIERINNILKDCNAKCLLVNSESPLLELLNIELINIDQNDFSSNNIDNPNLINTTEDLFYVIYTSGTTGAPKGVPIKHLGFLNLISNYHRIFNLCPTSRISQISNISFDAMCFEVWPCLTGGASLHIIDETTKFSSIILKQFIIKNNITHSFLPTVYAEKLIVEEWPLNIALQYLITAGDKLKKFSMSTHPFKFYNLYGPTEDTVWTTYKEVTEKKDGTRNTQFPSIGRPISNKKLYILDQQNNLLPIGVPGELYISGIGLARGYINKEELPNKKFINNPFEKGEILYKTGDLARWLLNTDIEILGRIDNQVKINGFRIELEEIEQCLQTHDKIKEAVVIIKESALGQKNIYAFYISKEELNSSEIKEYLQKVIPNYMIPRFFSRLEEIPLTSSGKVDKKNLLDLSILSLETDEIYEAPKNNVEKTIIDIWKELLNLQSIGVNDNFFDVGGHSLLIAKLTSLINNRTSIELDVMDIFRYPTIRSISNNFVISKVEDKIENSSKNSMYSKKDILNNILGNRRK